MSSNSILQSNNTDLQAILNTINALPEAGTDLPELTNPGTAADLMSGKELIGENGGVVTGTFTLDTELTEQSDLIAQIQSIAESLPDAESGTGSGETAQLGRFYFGESAYPGIAALFTFELGMTWQEFIDSEYNTHYHSVLGALDTCSLQSSPSPYVSVTSAGDWHITLDGTMGNRVLATDTIIDGYKYATYYMD